MSSLPKLNIKGLPHQGVDEDLISPVTPAGAENETGSRENDFGNKRRRIGGLPISALVNDKDDDSPVPYPGEFQAPVGNERVAPARPEFPSILYQMSEFVTQLEERTAEPPLPTLKSLGLPKTEELAATGMSENPTGNSQSHAQVSITSPNGIGLPALNALPPLKALRFPPSGGVACQKVSGKSADEHHSRAPESTLNSGQNEGAGRSSLSPPKAPRLPTAEEIAAHKDSCKSTDDGNLFRQRPSTASSKATEEPEHDEVVALGDGKDLSRTDSQDQPRASSRKRSRAERDAPITTEPEIETLIKKLREREHNRMEESNDNGSPQSPKARGDEEARAPSTGRDDKNLTPGVSRSAKVTKVRKQRRGRPNGDDRPRPHVCPTCQRRFHQQSGVVNHYRVVHLKEKRFECPHKCGLKFGARGDVTRHVDAVHNKLRNFECQVCGDAFARKSILTRHCKNMHNDVFGADEAHDCVHGCVYKSKNKLEGEDNEGDEK